MLDQYFYIRDCCTGNWLAIGAALAVAVLLGGPISGGNYNPAVHNYGNGRKATHT